jgi:glutathione synthase/RimK-type ligase-like ATP-grasp enzyme
VEVGWTMAGDVPCGGREVALAEAEARMAAAPEAAAPRFTYACLLEDLGCTERAIGAHIEVLTRQPDHLGSLVRLGNLLLASGRRDAAETAYREAIARHPGDPTAHVNLANLLLETGDTAAARERYSTALALAPDLPEAHQGMAHALSELGDAAAAARHRDVGYGARPVAALPYRGAGEAVSVLLLLSATGGNLPARMVLDDRVFAATALFADHFDSEAPLPPHRVIWNAIGDADVAGRALECAEYLLQRTGAPALNPPAAILPTSREENARRLGRLPGVDAPRTVTLPKALARADVLRGLGLPVLLRAPGFHSGRHLLRADRAEDIAPALERLPGELVTAIAFADVRSPDGWVRKYRAMIVDGRLHPAHLAISHAWKVHYATSDTPERPEHRAEEATFLGDMAGALGPAAMAALERVRRVLALDYGGIDFAVRPGGEVVVFEANATMVASPPPAEDSISDPRHQAAARIRAAVRDMVLRLAAV